MPRPVVDAGQAEGDHRAADTERRVGGPGNLLTGIDDLIAELHLALQHLDPGLGQIGVQPDADGGRRVVP